MFSKAIHRSIFFFGLIVLVIGLSLGAIFISLGQIIIGANWMLEGNFSEKIKKITKEKIAWPVLLFFGLHVIGLAWTENLSVGIEDIKVKLPLLALPLIFCTTSPLSNKELTALLKIYLSALVASTFWSMTFYWGWKTNPINDVRNLSRFFSHIRFSMHLVFAVFVCFWLYRKSNQILTKVLTAGLMLWLIIFLFLLSSLTGIFLLFILLIGYSFYFVLTLRKSLMKTSIIVLLLTGILGFGFYGYQTYRVFFTPRENAEEKLELWTSRKDLYYHESNLARENGYFVWRYNAYEELQECWNKKSSLKFDGKDRKGNPMRFTLIRYMTSKGFRKDADAFAKLSDEDIRQIENGVPNYKLVNSSPITRRIYEAMWELNDYLDNGSIRNHSMMVRLEYWKAARGIAKKNLLIGVGTGDIQEEFNQEYTLMNSVLKTQDDRKRSHNQFLETTVAHGILGLILLLLVLAIPIFQKRKLHQLFYPVYTILVISFLTEDTLETQAGVTLFAFFTSLFLFLVNTQDNKTAVTESSEGKG
jgi:O-Antigen ligase